MYQQPLYQANAAVWGQTQQQQQVQAYATPQAAIPQQYVQPNIHQMQYGQVSTYGNQQFVQQNQQQAGSQMFMSSANAQTVATYGNQTQLPQQQMQQNQLNPWGQQPAIHTQQTTSWNQVQQPTVQQPQVWGGVALPVPQAAGQIHPNTQNYQQNTTPNLQMQQPKQTAVPPPPQKPQPPLPQSQYQQSTQPPLPKQPPPPQQTNQYQSGPYQPTPPQQNSQYQPPPPQNSQYQPPPPPQNSSNDEAKQWVREPQIPTNEPPPPPPPDEPPANSVKQPPKPSQPEASSSVQKPKASVQETKTSNKKEEEESLASLNQQLETLESQIKTYQEEYQKWHADFVKWQKQHQNHPDQKQYVDYQKQYQKMIEEQQGQLKLQYSELQKKIVKRKAEHKAAGAAKVTSVALGNQNPSPAKPLTSAQPVTKPKGTTPDLSDKDINNLKTLAAHAQKLQVLQDLGEIKKNEGKSQSSGLAAISSNYKPPTSSTQVGNSPGSVKQQQSGQYQGSQQNLYQRQLPEQNQYQRDTQEPPPNQQHNINSSNYRPPSSTAQFGKSTGPVNHQQYNQQQGTPNDPQQQQPPYSQQNNYQRDGPTPNQTNAQQRESMPPPNNQYDKELPGSQQYSRNLQQDPYSNQYQRDPPNEFQRQNLPPQQQNRFQRQPPIEPQRGQQPPQNQFQRELPSSQENQYQRGPPSSQENSFHRGQPLSQGNNFQRGQPPSQGNSFQRGPPPSQENNFQRGPPPSQENNFQRGPPPSQENNFQRGPPPSQENSFQRGPPISKENNFQRGPPPSQENNFQRGPPPSQENNFQRGPPPSQENNFQRGQPPSQENNFQRGPPPSQENDFQRGPPSQDNKFQRGQPPSQGNNFQRGPPPSQENDFQRGPPPSQENNFQRGPPPSQESNFQRGPPPSQENNFQRGAPPSQENNFQRGPPPPQENQFQRGPPQENQYRREPFQNQYQREPAPPQRSHFDREHSGTSQPVRPQQSEPPSPHANQFRMDPPPPPPERDQFGREQPGLLRPIQQREPPPSPHGSQYRGDHPPQHFDRQPPQQQNRFQRDNHYDNNNYSEEGQTSEIPSLMSRETDIDRFKWGAPKQQNNPPHQNAVHAPNTLQSSQNQRDLPNEQQNQVSRQPFTPQQKQTMYRGPPESQDTPKGETSMPPGIVRTDKVNESNEKPGQSSDSDSKQETPGIMRRKANEYVGAKCKFFPKCRYGKECKFEHPMCRQTSKCDDPECPFEHPPGRDMEAVAKNSGKKGTKVSTPVEVEKDENTRNHNTTAFAMGSVLSTIATSTTPPEKKDYPKPTNVSTSNKVATTDVNQRKRDLPSQNEESRDPPAKVSKPDEAEGSKGEEKARSEAIQARIDEIFKKRQITSIANPYAKAKDSEKELERQANEMESEQESSKPGQDYEMKEPTRAIAEPDGSVPESKRDEPGNVKAHPDRGIKLHEHDKGMGTEMSRQEPGRNIENPSARMNLDEDEYERRKNEILGPQRANESRLPPGIVPVGQGPSPLRQDERRIPEFDRGREFFDRMPPDGRPLHPGDRYPEDIYRDRYRPPPNDRLRDFPPDPYDRYGREFPPYDRAPFPPVNPLYTDFRRDPYEQRREDPVSIDYGHKSTVDPYLERRPEDPYIERREPPFDRRDPLMDRDRGDPSFGRRDIDRRDALLDRRDPYLDRRDALPDRDRYPPDPLRERDPYLERRARDPLYEDPLYDRERGRLEGFPPRNSREAERMPTSREPPMESYDRLREPYERSSERYDRSSRDPYERPGEHLRERSRERARSPRYRDRDDRGERSDRDRRGYEGETESSRRREPEYRDRRDGDRGRSDDRERSSSSRDKDRRDSGRERGSSDRDRSSSRHKERESERRPRDRLPEIELKPEVFSAMDVFDMPGRENRPKNIVIILRGIPGAGKSYIAKLIKDKESHYSAQPPRILALDDYFMQDVENKETGTTEQQYVYEQEMEEPYRASLLKAFNKTLNDGFFPMVIVDAINHKTKHFDQFWSDAKHKGFEVYIADIKGELNICMDRSTHKRTLDEVQEMLKTWEEPPVYYKRLDTTALLQDAAIDDVEMEEAPKGQPVADEKEEEEEEELPSTFHISQSKWETAKEETLAKLDGVINRKSRGKTASPELPDDDDEDDPYGEKEADMRLGKKRVRWADLEEKKQLEHQRKIGFTIGMDWNIYTDPHATIPR